MRSVLALITLAAAVRAGGSIDNTGEQSRVVSSASTINGNGNYQLTNVASGQTLSFYRDGGVTNFAPNAGQDSVQFQFDGTAVRISGGNNKCVSAQWDVDYQDGVDWAAVAYACAVGDGQSGTDTLEKPKQWWYLVPAEGSDAPESTDDGDNDNGGDDSSVDVSFAAKSTKEKPAEQEKPVEEEKPQVKKEEPKESASTVEPEVAEPTTKAVKDEQAAKSKSSPLVNKWAAIRKAHFEEKAKAAKSEKLSHAKGFYESENSSISFDQVDVSKVIPTERKTWICRHPGWWLAEHPDYVTKAGHVECKDDLAAYLASTRKVRRSRLAHSDFARKLLMKRGGQEFYIIAQDHLHDMTTRAIQGGTRGTVGGYTSTTLEYWNQANPQQLWKITQA